MKYLLYLLVLLCGINATAQSKYPARLYYFVADSVNRIGGVRNEKGDTILPARYYLFAQENGTAITADFNLIAIDSNSRDSLNFGTNLMCFNRRGKFMYHPLWYDMAPDYYENGLRRFTENGRLGFVNRIGVKVIPAQFAWAVPFLHGLSMACYDCRFIVYDSTDEHGSGYGGGNRWALIDLKGNVLQKGDSNFARTFYRMPIDSISKALRVFPEFSAKERELIALLQQLPEVKERHSEMKIINGTETKTELIPEIYERPTPISKYPRHYPIFSDYCIAFVDKDGSGLNDLTFLISYNGKNIRHLDEDGHVLSLEAWRAQNREMTAVE